MKDWFVRASPAAKDRGQGRMSRHTYVAPLHVVSDLVKRLDRVVAVLSVDEHGAREGHCR